MSPRAGLDAVVKKTDHSSPLLASSISSKVTGGFIENSPIHVSSYRKHWFTTASRPALRTTQPPIQWVPGDLSLGVERPGSDADHSPPSSAEVKKCVELIISAIHYLVVAVTSHWLIDETLIRC
jgi:hypothetical protein